MVTEAETETTTLQVKEDPGLLETTRNWRRRGRQGAFRRILVLRTLPWTSCLENCEMIFVVLSHLVLAFCAAAPRKTVQRATGKRECS